MARLLFNVEYAFPCSTVAILLFFLSVQTIPVDPDINQEIEDIVVSSGNLELKRNSRDTRHMSMKFKNHDFGNWTKFKWDKWDNSSIFKKLDEMMESIERDLEELMNDTLSYSDFLKNTEMFSDMDESFSFSDSGSFSASESMSESEANEDP